ncbi:MAG: hypothetical protein Q4A70_04360, partial [Candidatus Saccharibacteria bacterium]|nr:hypothetical protein [Candidatus Saccharibacteria bacterium]
MITFFVIREVSHQPETYTWDEAEGRYHEKRTRRIGERVTTLSQIGPRQVKNDLTGAASRLYSDRLTKPEIVHQTEKETTTEERL